MNRLLALIMFCAFSLPAHSAPADPIDLLTWLALQNQAAHDKITSYSYRFEYQYNSQPSYQTTDSGTVIAKGDYLQTFSSQKIVNPPRNINRVSDRRLVINDHYIAEYTHIKGFQTYAHRNDFDSFDTLDSRTKSLIRRTRPLDILDDCFGINGSTFLQAISTRPDRFRWDAIKTEGPKGQTLYKIRRFSMARLAETLNPAPDKVWILDPQKDFLVIETRSYKSNGTLWVHRVIEPKLIDDDIWFPVSYKEEYFGSLDDNAMVATRSTMMTLDHVKVNETLSNSLFQIDALRLEKDFPDIIVLRTKTNGSRSPYVYYEGRLTSREVVDRIKAQQKP